MRNSHRPYAIIATVAMIASFAFAAMPALATTIVPPCATNQGVNAPGLGCIEETFLNVASLIIAVTGSFALLMFVYGGFTMITSNGAEKKVSEGKTILTNAVIGIILIFLAGYIIDYIKLRLTKGQVKATSCTDMAPSGYQCMSDPTQGRDCSTVYSGCGSAGQCCIPLTPDELKAAAQEAVPVAPTP